MQTIRNTGDLNCLQVLVAEGLGQKEQTVEIQIEGLIQTCVRLCSRQRPEVQNLRRCLIVLDDVGKQLIVVFSVSRTDLVSSVSSPLVCAVHRDLQNRVTGRLQLLGYFSAQT